MKLRIKVTLILLLIIVHLTPCFSYSQSSEIGGVVKPARKAILSFPKSGVLVKVPEEGQLVKKGDLIAQLDNRKALLSVSESKAALEEKQLAFETALHNSKKTERLLEEKILAPIALAEDEFKLKSAQAQVKIAEAKLKILEIDLDESSIQAPYNGLILNVEAILAEHISPGMQVCVIADLNSLQMTTDLPLDDTKDLKPGISKTIFIEEKQVGKAEVKTILPLLDPESGLRRVIWTVQSKNTLISGRYVTLSPR